LYVGGKRGQARRDAAVASDETAGVRRGEERGRGRDSTYNEDEALGSVRKTDDRQPEREAEASERSHSG
jgi:hypothetical protein